MTGRRNMGVALACLWLAGSVHAQDRPPAAGTPAAAPTRPICVDAEVDGKRALSYDCLSAQLKPLPTPEGAASRTAAEGLATAPSSRVGTFNLSTERNRFGSNWGKSVTPQRPAPPVAVPPK